MKILLEGAFGEANFGDDLLLLASIRAIKSVMPNVELQVLARDNSVPGDYLDRFPGIDKVIRGWKLATSNYKLKLYAGGTQFYSYPQATSLHKNSTQKIFQRLSQKLLRTIHRSKKNAFIGVGIGPFYNGNEKACERLLRTGDFISVRDEISMKYLNSWGVPSKALGADICFKKEWWLPPTAPIKTVSSSAPIGVIIRDFEYDLPGRNYFQPLVELMQDMRDSGKIFRCFAFSELKDKLSIEKLQSAGFDVNVWKGEMSELPIFINELSECSALISARYHGIVIGAVLGVPSIGIEVDPKVKLACDELGNGSTAWSSPFLKQEFVKKFEQLSSSPSAARQALADNTMRLSQRTQAMFQEFCSFVERGI